MKLRLGPLLRKTTATTATVWVETASPGTVTVSSADTGTPLASAATFSVHGHHYALCEITGLEPGSATPYTVELDGDRLWPLGNDTHPPSVIHTLSRGRLRLVFGSCRTPTDHSPAAIRKYGPDALRAYAMRLGNQRTAGSAEDGGEVPEPHALLLIGDQVYADEIQAPMREFLHGVRTADPDREQARPPEDEVVFYDEYAELYRQAWTDPDIRWLMSTVPTLMLFDDHDVRDDWNTSGSWRADMEHEPWWRRRVTSGFGSYWVYQHLGNLSAADRAADPLFTEVRAAAAEGRDAGAVVDAAAERAHTDPESALWSHEHEMHGSRLLMLDTRAGRDVADDARRSITGRRGAQWLDERLRGDTDHLIIATTLPYLMPRAIHHLEAWNEAVCAGAWGPAARAASEKLRREIDLEHWPAFRRSFDEVARTVLDTAAGQRGEAPATITFLSGDVHFHYLSRAQPRAGDIRAVGELRSTIHQLTASPMCNRLTGKLKLAAKWSSSAAVRAPLSGMARLARVNTSPLQWEMDAGPWFDNGVATLTIDGRAAEVSWAFAEEDRGTHAPLIHDRGGIRLTGADQGTW